MTTTVVEKRFSREAFAELLVRAATQLVDECRGRYCQPAPPQAFLFLIRPDDHHEDCAPRRLLDAVGAVPYLVREDGAFRDWINVSPVGTCRGATVLELTCSDRYTTRLLVGTAGFPFEPFHLLGPALPNSWHEGDPIPKVPLPELDLPAK